jgi:hypothetical protein
VFKAAPATTTLPAAGTAKAQGNEKPKFKRSEFAKIPAELRKSQNYEIVDG